MFHYLWQCTHVQNFWKQFIDKFKVNCSHCEKLNLIPSLVLLGKDRNITTDEGFDFILIHAIFFVYKCRLNKNRPRIEMFKNALKYIYNIHKHVHLMEMSIDKFYQKWLP